MPPAVACSLLGCKITTVSQSDHGLTINAHTTALTASCPLSRISSQRLHRYVTRRPHDLPLWDEIVGLVLCIGRFRQIRRQRTAAILTHGWPTAWRLRGELTNFANGLPRASGRPECPHPA